MYKCPDSMDRNTCYIRILQIIQNIYSKSDHMLYHVSHSKNQLKNKFEYMYRFVKKVKSCEDKIQIIASQ